MVKKIMLEGDQNTVNPAPTNNCKNWGQWKISSSCIYQCTSEMIVLKLMVKGVKTFLNDSEIIFYKQLLAGS